jgi:hypothetical protein
MRPEMETGVSSVLSKLQKLVKVSLSSDICGQPNGYKP